MKLDPETTIGRLLTALPSSALAFDKLGVTIAGKTDKTLRELCMEEGVSFQQFLRAMDEIDWDEEPPQGDDLNELSRRH